MEFIEFWVAGKARLRCFKIDSDRIARNYPPLLFGMVFVLGLLMSFFRSAFGDETYYLGETIVMADSIRHFHWFGNLDVGLHGFLFKIPVAFIFIFTGPSVFAATLFNILMSALSAVMCYRLAEKMFESPHWSASVSLLSVSSYCYFSQIPTYLRDIPALFVLLLLILFVIERKPYWVIGLLLLLLLDAKEYLFLIVMLPLVITIAADTLWFKGGFRSLKGWIKCVGSCSLIFIPSIIFITLMFTTPLFPPNMFLAYLTGMTQKSMSNVLEAFSVNTATYNQYRDGKNIVKFDPREQRTRTARPTDQRRDIPAQEAVKAAAAKTSPDETILLIDKKVDKFLSEVAEGKKILPYFYSEFPEVVFRRTNDKWLAYEILDKLKIGTVVVDPSFESNKYYLRSKMSDMLSDKNIFRNIYQDKAIGFKVYRRLLFSEFLFSFAGKITSSGGTILLVGEIPQEAQISKISKLDGKSLVPYFGGTFDLSKFQACDKSADAFRILVEAGVQTVVVDPSFDGMEQFQNSQLPSILADKKMATPIYSKRDYKIYRINKNYFEDKETVALNENINIKIESSEEKLSRLTSIALSVTEKDKKLLIVSELSAHMGQDMDGKGKTPSSGQSPERIVQYFGQDFDREKFMAAGSAQDAFEILRESGIGTLLLDSDSTSKQLCKESYLESFIAGGDYSDVVYESESYKVIVLKKVIKQDITISSNDEESMSPFEIEQDLITFAISVINPESFILLIGEPYAEEDSSKLISFFSMSFPAEELVNSSKDIRKAWYFLRKNGNIEAVLVDPSYGNRKEFIDSPIPTLLADKKYSDLIMTRGKFTLYLLKSQLVALELASADTDFNSGAVTDGGEKTEKIPYVQEEQISETVFEKTPPTEEPKPARKKGETVENGKKPPKHSKPLFGGIFNKLGRTLLAYYGKMCYPRTFSFLSVPLLVVIPSLVMAISLCISCFRRKDIRIFLPLFLLCFIAVYLLRASHGRYLLHIVPVVFTFFMMLVKDSFSSRKMLALALVIMMPFLIGNIVFEENYSTIKVLAIMFFYLQLLAICLYIRSAGEKSRRFTVIFLVSSFCAFTAGTALASSYKIGQIGKSLKFGNNCQMKEIARNFRRTDKIWFNTDLQLFAFYRHENLFQTKFFLKPSIPKSKMMEKSDFMTFSFAANARYFQDLAYRKGIKKVAILVADPEFKKFSNQEMLEDFKRAAWLIPEKEQKMKNKTLYIFKVQGAQ